MGEQDQVRMIEVVSYDLNWEKEYISESGKIQNILSHETVKIHHIGSTAILGI